MNSTRQIKRKTLTTAITAALLAAVQPPLVLAQDPAEAEQLDRLQSMEEIV
jgi:hypothetical protein